jgi:hypothetical protein
VLQRNWSSERPIHREVINISEPGITPMTANLAPPGERFSHTSHPSLVAGNAFEERRRVRQAAVPAAVTEGAELGRVAAIAARDLRGEESVEILDRYWGGHAKSFELRTHPHGLNCI